MSIPTGFLHASRNAALKAQFGARSDALIGGRPALLSLAVVTEIQPIGVQVCPLDDEGEKVKDPENPEDDLLIDGVIPVPQGEVSVDEVVVLWRSEGHDLPVILQTGGSECCTGTRQGARDYRWAGTRGPA